MATWGEFVAATPAQAEVAARLWPGISALARGEVPPAGGHVFAVAYLATIRPDGGPRLHPFCPFVAADRLLAAIPSRSPKGDDLRSDGRCVIHALPGPDDAELCIRATAIEVSGDAALRAAVAEVMRRGGVGGMAETAARDPLFAFDITQVDTAYWVDVGQPGTHAVRRRWRA